MSLLIVPLLYPDLAELLNFSDPHFRITSGFSTIRLIDWFATHLLSQLGQEESLAMSAYSPGKQTRKAFVFCHH